MLVGVGIKETKLLDESAISQLNSLIFKVLLPVLLFCNVRSSPLNEMGELSYFAYVFLMAIGLFAASTIFVIKIEKENFNRGVMAQAIARTNYALFGIPLIVALYPDGDAALASVLMAIVIPTFNITSVIVLSYFSDKSSDFKSLCKSIAKNPLILSTLLGIVASLINLKLPYVIEQALTNMSVITSPLSLILLGASFKFSSIAKYKKQIIISVFARLIAAPAIVLFITVLVGYRGIELACMMVIFAVPTAVSSFTMAKTMGGNEDLAASIVVFTSILCIFTLFLFIFVLKTLNLL